MSVVVETICVVWTLVSAVRVGVAVVTRRRVAVCVNNVAESRVGNPDPKDNFLYN